MAAEVNSIVACVLVAAGMGLRSRCLEMNVFSEFDVPAFGRHVIISNWAMFAACCIS
jgi:hypothetical protein